MASMRNSWSSITTYNPIPVPAYLSWTLIGESHPPVNQGDPINAPKQPAIRPNQQFFFIAKYMASIRHSGHSITTYNSTLVSAYLSWT